MNIYTIYRATNVKNGKVYIGFDSSWPKRKSEHKGDARRGLKYKFYHAIRKYGWDNFIWEPIYQSMDYTHTLTVIEPLFIAEYDSLANGYNGNKGGEGGSLGANWWNNGIIQVHTQVPPDKTFKRGRLKFNNTGAAIGAAVNALKYWVNDGRHEMMVFKTEELPEGYTKGRLLSKAFNGYDRSSVKGVSWWNNGVQSKMSLTCPGADYVRGRLPFKRRCTAI